MVPTSTPQRYEISTYGSGPPWEQEQLWSRVETCELPGLTEYEARQMILKVLWRPPEITTGQILNQAGNSIRRLTSLIGRLKELREINEDRDFADLISVAGQSTLVPTR